VTTAGRRKKEGKNSKREHRSAALGYEALLKSGGGERILENLRHHFWQKKPRMTLNDDGRGESLREKGASKEKTRSISKEEGLSSRKAASHFVAAQNLPETKKKVLRKGRQETMT